MVSITNAWCRTFARRRVWWYFINPAWLSKAAHAKRYNPFSEGFQMNTQELFATIIEGCETVGKLTRKYYIHATRIATEGFIAYKVFQETGPWTLIFVVCVTIAIELQGIWNTIQNKTNKERISLSTTQG
jgi:hypothetical protein